MKLTIETAANGYLIRTEVDEVNDKSELFVFSHASEIDDTEDVKTFARFLHYLNDLIGPSTSRYSKARVYIDVQPGDKCGDFEELDS